MDDVTFEKDLIMMKKPSSAQGIRPSASNQVQPDPSEDKMSAQGIDIAYEKNTDLSSGEALKNFSALSTSSFFLKHSYRDVGRKKFHFCLSFCSVFVVVWSSLLINTLVERGPIIFLKMAESTSG